MLVKKHFKESAVGKSTLRGSRKEREARNCESPNNGKSKLSLKPFGKDYLGRDDADLDEKSRRSSIMPPKCHHRDIKTIRNKN